MHAGGDVRLATSLKRGSEMWCVLVLRPWYRASRRQRRKQRHPCFQWPLPRQGRLLPLPRLRLGLPLLLRLGRHFQNRWVASRHWQISLAAAHCLPRLGPHQPPAPSEEREAALTLEGGERKLQGLADGPKKGKPWGIGQSGSAERPAVTLRPAPKTHASFPTAGPEGTAGKKKKRRRGAAARRV